MVFLGLLTLLPDPRISLSSRLRSSVVFGLPIEEAQSRAEGRSKRVALEGMKGVGDSWAMETMRVGMGERVVECGKQLLLELVPNSHD